MQRESTEAPTRRGVRKALISRGFGAGWSTWNTEYRDFFLFDAPLIEALERGEVIDGDDHPLLADFNRRFHERFGDDAYCYLGGGRDLVVETIEGPFRVTEYDGNEGIEQPEDIGWI